MSKKQGFFLNNSRKTIAYNLSRRLRGKQYFPLHPPDLCYIFLLFKEFLLAEIFQQLFPSFTAVARFHSPSLSFDNGEGRQYFPN